MKLIKVFFENRFIVSDDPNEILFNECEIIEKTTKNDDAEK